MDAFSAWKPRPIALPSCYQSLHPKLQSRSIRTVKKPASNHISSPPPGSPCKSCKFKSLNVMEGIPIPLSPSPSGLLSTNISIHILTFPFTLPFSWSFGLFLRQLGWGGGRGHFYRNALSAFLHSSFRKAMPTYFLTVFKYWTSHVGLNFVSLPFSHLQCTVFVILHLYSICTC